MNKYAAIYKRGFNLGDYQQYLIPAGVAAAGAGAGALIGGKKKRGTGALIGGGLGLAGGLLLQNYLNGLGPKIDPITSFNELHNNGSNGQSPGPNDSGFSNITSFNQKAKPIGVSDVASINSFGGAPESVTPVADAAGPVPKISPDTMLEVDSMPIPPQRLKPSQALVSSEESRNAASRYLDGANIGSKGKAPGVNDPGFAQANSFNDVNNGWGAKEVGDEGFGSLGNPATETSPDTMLEVDNMPIPPQRLNPAQALVSSEESRNAANRYLDGASESPKVHKRYVPKSTPPSKDNSNKPSWDLQMNDSDVKDINSQSFRRPGFQNIPTERELNAMQNNDITNYTLLNALNAPIAAWRYGKNAWRDGKNAWRDREENKMQNSDTNN